MAEALMVQAAMIEATVEAAAGDRVQLKEIGTAVKQVAAASIDHRLSPGIVMLGLDLFWRQL
jgi:hypothetical protein